MPRASLKSIEDSARQSAVDELFEKRGVLLPTLCSIVFVVSLFLIAYAGQNRLAESGEEIRQAEYRARRLAEFLHQVADAESAVRGYVITGERSYLLPYDRARPAIDRSLADLEQAYTEFPETLQALQGLRVLSNASLGLLQQVAERRTQDVEAATLLIRSNVGERTMGQLREVVGNLSQAEARIFDAAQARVTRDQVQGRWLLALGAALNVLLVILAGSLVARDLRRRAQLTHLLESRRHELELQVKERTHDLEQLSTHLQHVSEQERSALARELHDELGSLLVAARMDLSWLQRRLPTDDEAIRLRWQRIQDSLDAGVNLKRRVVEQLRPTLLDNMGLYAALRWQLQESCGRAGLTCIERYPLTEPPLKGPASIAIFRLVQEALTNICKHARAQSMNLEVRLEESTRELVVRISDDGVGLKDAARRRSGSHGLASMRHRVQALGGTWQIGPQTDTGRGTLIEARFPLDGVLADPVPTEDETGVEVEARPE